MLAVLERLMGRERSVGDTGVVVVGVDGGGTKTHAVVVDDRGTPLGAGVAGPSNWESVGISGARRAITAAVEGALGRADLRGAAIDAAVYALAGYDWPSDDSRMSRVLSGLPG